MDGGLMRVAGPPHTPGEGKGQPRITPTIGDPAPCMPRVTSLRLIALLLTSEACTGLS